jgi:kynurenine formamidase
LAAATAIALLAKTLQRPRVTTFSAHNHMLTQGGIHLIENAKLDELANDRVWLACTMILPLREKGAAGSAVRPVANGASPKPVPRGAARK